MKRISILFLGAALCLTLGACQETEIKNNDEGNTEQTSETSETEIAEEKSETPESVGLEEDSVEKQIQLIANNAALWKVFDEIDGWGYAVTDLDQNGRLEVISSECHGTGFYSTNNVWEVNENFDDLSLCEQTKVEGSSEADIMVEKVPVFYDSVQNSYYFVFDDLTKNGAAEYYENKRAWVLRNGQITETMLAYKSTIYNDSDADVTCLDTKENTISEEEYVASAEEHFNNLEKLQADVGWISTVQTADIEIEELYKMLETSYYAFKIQ